MGDYATVTNPGPDQAERTFERIIGNSAALESVLDQVEQVAPPTRLSSSRGKPAREKNSLLTPFTMPVSAAGALL